MRKPRPEAFDPNVRRPTPEAIDLQGVKPLLPKAGLLKHPAPAETPPHQEVAVSRYHGGTVSRHHDTADTPPEQDVIAHVRRAVKAFGKEAATHRFTLAEKKAVAEIVFAYQNQGIRTSENEITRIAINYIFHDYRQNGENSLLHQVLRSLNE
jgi:hypothetical protein